MRFSVGRLRIMSQGLSDRLKSKEISTARKKNTHFYITPDNLGSL